MIAKIVLTLEQDEERGTNEAMEETVQILATLDVMPMMKLVLTLECEEVVAERYRAMMRSALRRRPIGIVMKFKTTTEEEVMCERMPPVTPMDQLLRNGGTVTLGREHFDALQQAGAQLRGAGDENLFDADV